MFARLHHVQLAMPKGQEERARQFYVHILGMLEIDKPEVLAARGGAWFRAGDVELHLGVEEAFRPARKAHPGILVDDLDALADRLATAGQPTAWDDDFPGHRRIYAHDPFGNRLEFLQPLAGDGGISGPAPRL
ncbi:VOC family protein [Pseudonocardia acaciae]|uniref:VOC family protein n=1 Tax=Pseudonocardia acaciae TaxID=551276 RepID=UPI00048E6A46|nr:VOC family protein [Pseudonocardia acaciae]